MVSWISFIDWNCSSQSNLFRTSTIAVGHRADIMSRPPTLTIKPIKYMRDMSTMSTSLAHNDRVINRIYHSISASHKKKAEETKGRKKHTFDRMRM